jgi:hypothetical protein
VPPARSGARGLGRAIGDWLLPLCATPCPWQGAVRAQGLLPVLAPVQPPI